MEEAFIPETHILGCILHSILAQERYFSKYQLHEVAPIPNKKVATKVTANAPYPRNSHLEMQYLATSGKRNVDVGGRLFANTVSRLFRSSRSGLFAMDSVDLCATRVKVSYTGR